MSPNAVNNFVADLVEMAKAVEELPQVQAELTDALATIDNQRQIISFRDAEIASLRGQIATMATKVADLEVARDDAELRFLDLEERVGKFTTALAVALEAMDVADALAKGLTAKPEIVAEVKFIDPKPADAKPQGESATDPIDAQIGTTNALSSVTSDVKSTTEGVSVRPDPTASGYSPTTELPNASMPSVETPTSAADSTASDPPKPYLGKHYTDLDVPAYLTYDQWIAGGGYGPNYYR